MAKQKTPKRTWYDEVGVSDLVRELIKLRDIGVLGLRERPMSDELPIIIRKAREIHRRARSDYVAVDRLISRAIGRINNETYREAATYEFGLGRAAGMSSRERREHIYTELIPTSERTFRRAPQYERRIIEWTAQEITDLDIEQTEELPRFATTPYVPRHDVNGNLIDQWRVRENDQSWLTKRRVCIVGEPGTGKSRYVWETLRSDNPVWVDAQTHDGFNLSIINALEHYGVILSDLSTSSLRREFGRLLTGTAAPSVVVIDGIEDPASLDEFVPSTTRSFLVTTSRRRPPEQWAPCVDVRDMGIDDAAELVGALCPDVEPQNRRILAQLLGGRAQAIVQACALLNRYDDIETNEFCQALASDMTRVLDAGGDRSSATFSFIYSQIIERLDVDHPASVEVLLFLAFIGQAFVLPKCVMALLSRGPFKLEALGALGKLNYVATVRPLVELCLVEASDSRIAMSPFAQGIIRRLLADRLKYFVVLTWNLLSHSSEYAADDLDLLGLGWNASEVASFASCLAVFQMLYGPYIVDILSDDLGTEARDMLVVKAWSALGELLSNGWDQIYPLYVYLETPQGAELLQHLEPQPRQAWVDILALPSAAGTVSISALPQDFLRRLRDIMVVGPMPSDDEVQGWMRRLGVRLPNSRNGRKVWKALYLLWQVADEGKKYGLKFDWPSDDSLLASELSAIAERVESAWDLRDRGKRELRRRMKER